MVTNTYSPFVSGLVRSIEDFSEEFRRRGHRVLVVAPSFPGAPKRERGVLRVPSIRRIKGSEFSYGLPFPTFLFPDLEKFRPDVVHSHHPFALGDMALRIAASRNAPLIFTHHTMHEELARYVLGDSPAVRRFVIELSTGYANLCDHVIAPSLSTRRILRERGVRAPVEVIPTGIHLGKFLEGDGTAFRASMGIPGDAFVVGHVGRLVSEKNLEFLAEAVIAFMEDRRDARFLLVGTGPSVREIRERFKRCRMADRLVHAGVLRGDELAGAYNAMDVFAFASRTETQGMVLAEAMAAGVPVVALDAPGAREAIVDGRNGFLLPSMSVLDFSKSLTLVADAATEARFAMKAAARETAGRYSIQQCAGDMLLLYGSALENRWCFRDTAGKRWGPARRLIWKERMLWRNRAHAAAVAFSALERAGGRIH
jgi:glycosyltransferase involved in cell wall biosynthesis